MKIKIAITQGDINGIGYQVILKALEDNRILELCTPEKTKMVLYI